jgi:uncharacterized protein
MIPSDPDDDKFVDCAIAGDADFIITTDHHFDMLGKTAFPSMHTVSPKELQLLLQEYE